MYLSVRRTRYTGALAALVGLLGGCARHIETRDVVSPDHEITLRIAHDLSGGAAVPDVTSVYLLLPKASASNGTLIFKGSTMWNFSAAWRGSRIIELSYTDGFVSKCVPVAELSAAVKVSVLGCKLGGAT